MRKNTLLVSLFLLGMQGYSLPADAIIRRHDLLDDQYIVNALDYPAVVDLLAVGDCIGTLIHPSFLLTAAHCAEHLKDNATLEINGSSYGVADYYLHEDYADDENDIAMVELEKSVDDVDPIPWYTGSDEEGKEVLFVGRGDTGTGLEGQSGATADGKTRKASNTVASIEEGNLMFIFHHPDDDGVTSLEGISGDGDSGGPAFIQSEGVLQIAGISSYQDENGNELGQYGVHEYYARVSDYDDWIQDVIDGEIKGESGCSGCSQVSGSPIPLPILGFFVGFALYRRQE